MANPLMPRSQVHAWSESIGTDQPAHQSAIQRLIRDQRRLSKFVEENAKGMKSNVTGGVAVYLIGVIVRMFDLAGGRMRNVTWEDVREAEKRIGGMVDLLLPVDAGLVERARAVPRAQAHILDEALYALFERESKPEEDAPLDETESFKIYLLMWIATEALDKNWTPPKEFAGETEYTFTPVAPPTPAS